MCEAVVMVWTLSATEGTDEESSAHPLPDREVNISKHWIILVNIFTVLHSRGVITCGDDLHLLNMIRSPQ